MELIALDHLITLNNRGVLAIANGRYGDAIAPLTKASQIIQETSSFLRPARLDTAANVVAMDLFMMERHHEDDARLNLNIRPTYLDDRRERHQLLFYSQPIQIEPLRLPIIRSSLINVYLATVFNLALALQLSALSRLGRRSSEGLTVASEAILQMNSGNRRRYIVTNLREALRLYTTLYFAHYQNEQRNISNGRPTESRNVLLLALLNNSGLLLFLLGETEKADRCFQQLLAALMWLRSTRWWFSQDDTRQLYREAGIFDSFFENIGSWFQHKGIHENAAPAA